MGYHLKLHSNGVPVLVAGDGVPRQDQGRVLKPKKVRIQQRGVKIHPKASAPGKMEKGSRLRDSEVLVQQYDAAAVGYVVPPTVQSSVTPAPAVVQSNGGGAPAPVPSPGPGEQPQISSDQTEQVKKRKKKEQS